MADPVTMMAVAGGTQAAAGAFGAVSTANAEKYNRRFAQQNASIALAQAAEEAHRIRRIGARRSGSMTASYGAGNIALTGSAAAVLVDQARQTELDALTAKYQGDLQARQWESEAQAAKMRRRNAIIGGVLGVGASALSTGAGVSALGSRGTSTGGKV